MEGPRDVRGERIRHIKGVINKVFCVVVSILCVSIDAERRLLVELFC